MTTSSQNLVDDREFIVQQVRKLGSAASSAILDPSCQFFSLPEIEGIIGYRIESSCAVVYGNPVCSTLQRPQLVEAFNKYCKTNRLHIIYIGVDEAFAKWSIGTACQSLVEFGDELVIDPHSNPQEKQGANACLVRRKVKHALKEGTEFFEYIPNDPAIEVGLENVATSWLHDRQGPQVHISHVSLFSDRMGKRWFYVRKRNKIVGVVMLNQLQAQQGWLLNHLMFTKEASNGTPELLLTSTLEILAKEGCHFVTFGHVPSADLGEIIGLGKAMAWVSRILFKITNKFLRLEGRRKFWEKFHPESIHSYLLFSEPKIGLREIVALKRAMNVKIQ